MRNESLAPGACVLRGFAEASAPALIDAIAEVTSLAPWRHMTTPGGFRMSVAMSNCGSSGWVSDDSGYRYDSRDPQSGQPWPPMPEAFRELGRAAAAAAGYAAFEADACLINRYAPATRLSLHQDKNERDFAQPIVSVSLGVPAVFLFGGLRRNERTAKILLMHGDVVVWGGPSRLRYHGVLPLKAAHHPATGGLRFNLTLRKAA